MGTAHWKGGLGLTCLGIRRGEVRKGGGTNNRWGYCGAGVLSITYRAGLNTASISRLVRVNAFTREFIRPSLNILQEGKRRGQGL